MKYILDPACSNRCFYIDKNNPYVLYCDLRKVEKGILDKKRPNYDIKPDHILDYRYLPFKDKSFKHIVFDPPHLTSKKGMNKLNGLLQSKYGSLNIDTWKSDLTLAFKELWRVLDNYGTLNLKFNNYSIPFKEVLNLFPVRALYGTTTTTKKHCQTRFFTFVKGDF
tara:strand:- start:8 stop:505 length:498 start_codon:yes stop_codon:yes gene_type:complete